MLNNIGLKNVHLLAGLFRERMSVNRNYLMELDSNCLLQNFYLEAGIIIPGLQVVDDPASANLHWGWEAPTCQLRGHFLGHWLSAAAKLVASENDAELKVKTEHIISELARCQQLNGGKWIGSIPEKYFTMMEKNQYVWSPQYTMHKTIMGLADVYEFMGNTQALEIVNNLADWYIDWTEKTAQTNPWAVYKGENGGMLEIWARLYGLTKDERYKTLVDRYKDAGLFKNLKDGKDDLTNCHANASIPLSHGAAKLYEIRGDENWKNITELFWKCAVTDRGMYATSGQNAGEFWIPPYMQAQFMGDKNQEFCTVYNMVRTASYLYKWTGNTEYADYIERCLYNGFLAQQNPDTGMPTYFLPMNPGSKKKWGTKTRDFWCCHGTMVQAQTIYPELIYYTDDAAEKLLVSQYIPSSADMEIGGHKIHFEQSADMKYYNDQAFFDETDSSQMSRWSLKFNVKSDGGKFTVAFRVPAWTDGTPTVKLNGEDITPEIVGGYISITKDWSDDTVNIFFPDKIVMEPLPDMPEAAAAVDGPIVLAGITDTDTLEGDFSAPETIFMPQQEHTYSTFPWQQTSFRTRRQPKNILFRPLYEIKDEAYTLYFSQK